MRTKRVNPLDLASSTFRPLSWIQMKDEFNALNKAIYICRLEHKRTMSRLGIGHSFWLILYLTTCTRPQSHRSFRDLANLKLNQSFHLSTRRLNYLGLRKLSEYDLVNDASVDQRRVVQVERRNQFSTIMYQVKHLTFVWLEIQPNLWICCNLQAYRVLLGATGSD